jgi:hypothetical protein
MTKADKKLLNIVAFCCLMENTDGIMGKSPDYILEKYHRYCEGTGEEFRWGLHPVLYEGLFKKWAERWRKKIGGEKNGS